jgi:hypothetical protein
LEIGDRGSSSKDMAAGKRGAFPAIKATLLILKNGVVFA